MGYEVVEGNYVKTPLKLQQPQGGRSITLVEVLNTAPVAATIASTKNSVGTSLASIFTATVLNAIEIHAVILIPSSNADGNGVKVRLLYGNNVLASAANANDPIDLTVPLTLGFDSGSYPVLNQNDGINLEAIATATGSTVQVIIHGVYL